MDEHKELPQEEVSEQTPAEEKPKYVPRPKWQLALAWVLLAIMVVGVCLYYYGIAFPY